MPKSILKKCVVAEMHKRKPEVWTLTPLMFWYFGVYTDWSLVGSFKTWTSWIMITVYYTEINNVHIYCMRFRFCIYCRPNQLLVKSSKTFICNTKCRIYRLRSFWKNILRFIFQALVRRQRTDISCFCYTNLSKELHGLMETAGLIHYCRMQYLPKLHFS